MADIRQCNRTAFFGLINPEADDFITLAGDTRGMDGMDDILVQEIEDKLVVRSYKEFEDKFATVVYSFFDANSQRPIYTLERPDPQTVPAEYLTEIPLGVKNPTTGMLYTMLDSKAAGGFKNIDFGYENILDQISPRKMVQNVKQIRKELQHNYLKYEALPDGDPLKDEVGETLNRIFAETREYFNNVPTMLAVAIQDCESRLFLGASEDGGRSEKVAVGLIDFADDGALKVIEAPQPDETALMLAESGVNATLAKLLESDYDDSAGEQANNYVKALIVRTFSPLSTSPAGKIDLVKETKNHNDYLDMYTDAQAAFLSCAKPAIEMMLGVYSFFKQYKVQNPVMRPELVVMNCDPEMLTKSAFLVRLETYLSSVNSKTDSDKAIWLGIVANLTLNSSSDEKEVKQVFKTAKTKKKTNLCSMETLTLLLNILADHQVKLFFSFETGEDTTFDKVSREGITAFQDRCEPLMNKDYSAYAVPCLPNVTVIPKNKSGVIMGKLLNTDGDTVEESKEQADIRRFWISGVYVPIAFVAAGIYAAFQCPEYLREKFNKNVDPFLPGVRYDVEAGNNALITTTTMAKEISGFPQKVKSDINRQGFGFILGSENLKVPNSGKSIGNLIVYKARSLASDGQNFEPIFQTQVAAYFERMLRMMTGDNKMDNVKYFFSANPNSQMSLWSKRNEYINAIVQVGDHVTYEIDPVGNNCDIQFAFGSLSKNLRVKLNRSNLETV